MATAGYSGTPLVRKLGIEPGMTLAIVDAPPDFERTLGPLPPGVTVARPAGGPVDVCIVFHVTPASLAEHFLRQARGVRADGALWIAWPKKSSGVATDLTEDRLRDVGLPTGMFDNKVCAIDRTWSGLRFVVRKELRGGWTPR